MIDTILHALGVCGDVHPKLFDLMPSLHYITNGLLTSKDYITKIITHYIAH